MISIIDRMVHHSEIQSIDAESYRMHEATEQASRKQARKTRGKRSHELESRASQHLVVSREGLHHADVS